MRIFVCSRSDTNSATDACSERTLRPVVIAHGATPRACLVGDGVRKVQRGSPRVQQRTTSRQSELARRRQVLVRVGTERPESGHCDRESAASGTIRLIHTDCRSSPTRGGVLRDKCDRGRVGTQG